MGSPIFPNGTTITFGTSGLTGLITNIKPLSQKREALASDHLGTPAGGKPFEPAPLFDNGEIELTMFHNPDTNLNFAGPKEVVTITFPPYTGQTNGGTIASDAFITDHSIGDLKNNEFAMRTLKLKRSGNVTRTSGS